MLAALLPWLRASAQQTPAPQVLAGHVPKVVNEWRLSPVGRLPATQRLPLAIGLPLRNNAALAALLQQLYNPASPNYRHYLTPAQFAERFGPTPADYQALIDFAGANGLRITGTHPNRVILDVDGSVADIERALHVTLREYQHPQEARTFYAPDAEPSLDLTVPVLHIAGLDNVSLPHPNLRVGPAAPAGHVVPQAGAEGGEYIGNDFRAAYVPGSRLYGTGQSVALLEFDGYYASDITHYEALAGLPAVTLTNIPINGGPITPGPGDGEVSLDIEMAISMATNLTQILVYEGTNGVTSWATILNQIANDDLANQVSCSWSGGSADPSASQVFLQMAAQGQSFFNAAGDSDAFTGAIPFPSADTNITIVGGTTLSTTGPGGSYLSESVWNWCVEYGTDYCSSQSHQCRNCQGPTGSSGGVSTSYAIPPWQQGISMTANQGSTTMRNVPDVALTADHVFVAYGNGLTNWFGGTSCATPLWAAFTALVNQQAAANGLRPVGFLNPALYAIGKGANYTNCFHDITTGNNEWTGSETKYTAVTGYDLCTGWGTPTGTNLINALSGSAVAPALLGVSPASYNFGALATGTAAQTSFVVTNTGGGTLTGTVAAAGPFAIVSGGSYSVAGAGSTNVVVSFTPPSPGSFSNSVVFTSNGGVSTNAVTGTGLTPANLIVNPGSLNFGTIATGTTAQAAFIVTNSGGALLSGTAVAGGAFAISSGSSYNVAGFGTTNVVVDFTPFSLGNFATNVVFASNGGNSTNAVTGSGVAFPFAVFSASPTTGAVPLTVTFTDNSTGTITNRFWSFGDGATSNLTLTTVAHAYSVAGTNTVRLIVSGPLGNNTNTQVNLIVAVNPPQLMVSPGSLNFGSVVVGQTSNQFFSVIDTGGLTLTGSATVAGAPYSITAGSPFTVAPGQTQTVTVAFAPVAAGTFSTNLIVASNGGASTNALTGVGVTPAQLAVSPLSWNFGVLATGGVAYASFTATNSGGAALSGAASVGLPFAVVTNGTFSLAGFASTNVVVQFAPATTGTWTSNVVFTSTGGISTNAVSGVSLTPGSIAVMPATLNFGALATGTTAQASFVVTNSGGMAVTNGTATVSGGPFTIVSGAAFSVSGLGSTNVVVQFAPVNAGGFTNTVVFTTANGGNATNTVTGAGAVAPVASFTAAPTNGIAPLSVAFTDTSTGSITNWSWNFGDGGTTNLATNAVVYTYNTAGVYTVSEIVTGPGGSSTNTRPNYIVVLTPFQGWQIRYFISTNNPNAAPTADADGTGQNNLFKFVAGLDPTNPASVFVLTIIGDTNQPNAQDLQFLPMVEGRTYTPQFNTDLVNGVWLPLATDTGPVTNGSQISVTDTNPLPPQEFYRIEISLP